METPGIDFQALCRPHWTPQESANAALVVDFVRRLMNEHDYDAVRERHGDGPYRQHNRSIADGIEGVIETVRGFVKRFPDYSYDVKHVFVDDDMVILHSHATLRKSHRGDDRKGFNITDRWRVADGAIVEHWDSVEPVDGFGRFYALMTGGAVRNANGAY